jgi:F0F1-type ATP synthase membrane subunit a
MGLAIFVLVSNTVFSLFQECGTKKAVQVIRSVIPVNSILFFAPSISWAMKLFGKWRIGDRACKL